MAVTADDIKFYLSSNEGLGGAITANLVPEDLNALFGYITGNDAAVGKTQYRCIYVKNNSAGSDLNTTICEIATVTNSPDTHLEIAVGGAINATAVTIVDENTAPVGPTFVANPTTIALGDLTASDFIAVWIKYVVGVNAAAVTVDLGIINVSGDTV